MKGRCAVHVKIKEKKGVVNLSSTNDEEEALLNRISLEVKEGQQLEYGGRDGADHGMPYTEHMELFFKLGQDKVKFVATSEEDECNIRGISDAIFFGGGGLYMVAVRYDVSTWKKSLDMCVGHCKHCKMPLVQMIRVEWETCDACTDKCDHHYIRMAIHGGNADQLPGGPACYKCGRVKPESKLDVVVPHYPKSDVPTTTI